MGLKKDKHEAELQAFFIKRALTIHNLGYYRGSLDHILGIMNDTTERMLKYKDLLAAKSALQSRTESERIRKYRHRNQNMAPAYCAGQGDNMPIPEPELLAPSADLPDMTVPSTEEPQLDLEATH